MRPRVVFNVPKYREDPVDGLDIREFRVLIPPDGPAGLTIRWAWTAKGQVLAEDSKAFAVEEMGDTADLERAVATYLLERLKAAGKAPPGATSVRGAEPVKETPPESGTPLVGLG